MGIYISVCIRKALLVSLMSSKGALGYSAHSMHTSPLQICHVRLRAQSYGMLA